MLLALYLYKQLYGFGLESDGWDRLSSEMVLEGATLAKSDFTKVAYGRYVYRNVAFSLEAWFKPLWDPMI